MVASSPNIPDIRSLSFEDRLALMERIWDSLIAEGRAISLTAEQKAELDRRLEEYAKDPDAGITWEELRQRMREGR